MHSVVYFRILIANGDTKGYGAVKVKGMQIRTRADQEMIEKAIKRKTGEKCVEVYNWKVIGTINDKMAKTREGRESKNGDKK